MRRMISELDEGNVILRYQLSKWTPLDVARRETWEDGEWVQLPFTQS